MDAQEARAVADQVNVDNWVRVRASQIDYVESKLAKADRDATAFLTTSTGGVQAAAIFQDYLAARGKLLTDRAGKQASYGKAIENAFLQSDLTDRQTRLIQGWYGMVRMLPGVETVRILAEAKARQYIETAAGNLEQRTANREPKKTPLEDLLTSQPAGTLPTTTVPSPRRRRRRRRSQTMGLEPTPITDGEKRKLLEDHLIEVQRLATELGAGGSGAVFDTETPGTPDLHSAIGDPRVVQAMKSLGVAEAELTTVQGVIAFVQAIAQLVGVKF